SWKGLQTGQHRIWEVDAAEGYLHNQNVLVFEVSAGGEITVLSQADASYGVIRTSIGEAGKFVIEVENKLGKKLPETGRSAALAVTVTGTVFCLLGIRKRKIGGKKNEK
ncbi:MAG: hypothetical protein UHS49_01585, partial [Faecalimonas sp.]|nr:hypothetical protein [Faecalimonas sp.]